MTTYNMQCCLACDYYAPWGFPASGTVKALQESHTVCPICGDVYIWAIVTFGRRPREIFSSESGLRDKGVCLSTLKDLKDKEFVRGHLITENDIQYWVK